MSCRWGRASLRCCWKEAEERPQWELAVPEKHLSRAKSFPEEEQQSRMGPQQQTQVGRQQTRMGLQQTLVGLRQTQMGYLQKLRTRWRPLRTAEDQHRPQCPRGSERQLGGNPGGLQTA